MQRFQQERTPEQEKIERRRLVPPHMHISLDLIEFVHLVSAMLLEVPNMAADTFDLRRRIISRPLRKWLDHYQRQAFVGPPENTRDHVIAATRALGRGDWLQCVELIMKLPAWRMVPNDEGVRVMLRRKIQEEGLRTYLFAYSTFYDSFSLAKLADMFGLKEPTVHAIVSKMMIKYAPPPSPLAREWAGRV
jgi:translation initiation factor 3 subunit C